MSKKQNWQPGQIELSIYDEVDRFINNDGNSLSDLANETGIARSILYRWFYQQSKENQRKLNLSHAEKLAEFFGLKMAKS